MTRTDQIILQLLRKALNTDCPVDNSLFQGVDWAEVIDVAFDQGVAGIAFEGVERLPDDFRPDLDNLMEWFGQVEYQKNDYRLHKDAVAELAQFFAEQGIRMMLLKGYGLSLYWPVPEHRPTGDVDVYFFGEWKRADRLVREKLGIEVESGHEHHTTFSVKGVMVENHYDFINTKAHKDAKRIEAKLKELALKAESVEVRTESPISLPSADFNVIFLIRHLGQHFAGERITLRQLLDWGLFLQADGDKVNWGKVVPFLKDMGIWVFFNQINSICKDYLGLTLDKIPDIERNEELERRIMEDVLHPEFAEEKPEGLVRVVWFKARRWWYNRWKHPLVYDEWLVPMFLTLAWSKVRRGRTIGD